MPAPTIFPTKGQTLLTAAVFINCIKLGEHGTFASLSHHYIANKSTPCKSLLLLLLWYFVCYSYRYDLHHGKIQTLFDVSEVSCLEHEGVGRDDGMNWHEEVTVDRAHEGDSSSKSDVTG